MLSERRNHILFNPSEVCVFHVFYLLARANFMIIAPYCFYVQRCRTSHFALESKLDIIADRCTSSLILRCSNFVGCRPMRKFWFHKRLHRGFYCHP
ncbi:hypothetical protein EAY42_16645 [Vibrio anguillarum]|nr:hypothetical protein [Vibrio anguillarum]